VSSTANQNDSSAQKTFKQSSERMKTEVIHEQAKQLAYIRQKLEDAEDEVKTLSTRLRSLELKYKVLQRTNEKLEQEYEQFKLSST
jgi:predicted RNase H-like nuclease (RuvC/YqgF family)